MSVRRTTAAVVIAVGLGACRARGHATAPPVAEPAAAEAVATAPADARDPDALPARPPLDALTSPTGVAIRLVARGEANGRMPHAGDTVELRFRVWNEHGRLLGASRPDRDETLAIAWLPPGWAEAMCTLHEGDHAQIWVPSALAYADQPDAPQGPLMIEVELHTVHGRSISDARDVPLLAPPPNALQTSTGLSFVVLREGTGTRHATASSRVTVHYEGWTADGQRFDSSYERGRPTTFPLTAVIPGWQEAVPLMLEGEKTRFWIPAELAYGQSPGKPQGMLIFDIELVSIDD